MGGIASGVGGFLWAPGRRCTGQADRGVAGVHAATVLPAADEHQERRWSRFRVGDDDVSPRRGRHGRCPGQAAL